MRRHTHENTYHGLRNCDSFHGNMILRLWGSKSFIADLLYLAIIRNEFASASGNANPE